MIERQEIAGMIEHWLGTPVDGYLGSGYGFPGKDLLHQPLQGGADIIIAKIKRDIPALSQADVNLYAVDNGVDKIQFFIDINSDVQVAI